MPKLLRRVVPKLPFREDIFGSIVGIEGKGLGKLSAGYRETCYGGDELQFRVRSAKVITSPLGDGYANSELRRLGMMGLVNDACPDCHMEKSCSGHCLC